MENNNLQHQPLTEETGLKILEALEKQQKTAQETNEILRRFAKGMLGSKIDLS